MTSIAGHLIAALSSVFPDGEDFFVRSVRHFRDRITDPELKRQVAGFIGQEAMHGREHRVFNDRLAELGYPTKHYERLTKRRACAVRERILPAKSNLAATAALEHFTATLAELVLTNEEIRDHLGDRRRCATCSSGTRWRSPSTRPWPSTSTGRSAAASACGCGR